MILELTIIPRGGDSSISGDIAHLVGIIEESGLDYYRMTAFGTLIEGSRDRLMDVAKRCHFAARDKTGRVSTMLRIDDYGERHGEIQGAVDRVEGKLGHRVKR